MPPVLLILVCFSPRVKALFTMAAMANPCLGWTWTIIFPHLPLDQMTPQACTTTSGFYFPLKYFLMPVWLKITIRINSMTINQAKEVWL
jgi:hypothetical protein